MNLSSFFAELKRRNVLRMAGLYLVGAWLVVQVAGTACPQDRCWSALDTETHLARAQYLYYGLRDYGLGPAPRRSALRKNRRLACAERETLISPIATNRTTTLALIRVES